MNYIKVFKFSNFLFFEDINKIEHNREKGQRHLVIKDKDGDIFQIDDHDIGTLLGDGNEKVLI